MSKGFTTDVKPRLCLLQELGKLNLVKAVKETISSKEFMGRLSVPLDTFAEAPKQWHDAWYPLGKSEWSNPDGCGRGEGELHLKLHYLPFDAFDKHPSRSSNVGCLPCLFCLPVKCNALNSVPTFWIGCVMQNCLLP